MVSKGVRRLPKVTESDSGASVLSGNGTVARHAVDTSTRTPPGQGGAQTESRQNAVRLCQRAGETPVAEGFSPGRVCPAKVVTDVLKSVMRIPLKKSRL